MLIMISDFVSTVFLFILQRDYSSMSLLSININLGDKQILQQGTRVNSKHPRSSFFGKLFDRSVHFCLGASSCCVAKVKIRKYSIHRHVPPRTPVSAPISKHEGVFKPTPTANRIFQFHPLGFTEYTLLDRIDNTGPEIQVILCLPSPPHLCALGLTL